MMDAFDQQEKKVQSNLDSTANIAIANRDNKGEEDEENLKTISNEQRSVTNSNLISPSIENATSEAEKVLLSLRNVHCENAVALDAVQQSRELLNMLHKSNCNVQQNEKIVVEAVVDKLEEKQNISAVNENTMKSNSISSLLAKEFYKERVQHKQHKPESIVDDTSDSKLIKSFSEKSNSLENVHKDFTTKSADVNVISQISSSENQFADNMDNEELQLAKQSSTKQPFNVAHEYNNTGKHLNLVQRPTVASPDYISDEWSKRKDEQKILTKSILNEELNLEQVKTITDYENDAQTILLGNLEQEANKTLKHNKASVLENEETIPNENIANKILDSEQKPKQISTEHTIENEISSLEHKEDVTYKNGRNNELNLEKTEQMAKLSIVDENISQENSSEITESSTSENMGKEKLNIEPDKQFSIKCRLDLEAITKVHLTEYIKKQLYLEQQRQRIDSEVISLEDAENSYLEQQQKPDTPKHIIDNRMHILENEANSSFENVDNKMLNLNQQQEPSTPENIYNDLSSLKDDEISSFKNDFVNEKQTKISPKYTFDNDDISHSSSSENDENISIENDEQTVPKLDKNQFSVEQKSTVNSLKDTINDVTSSSAKDEGNNSFVSIDYSDLANGTVENKYILQVISVKNLEEKKKQDSTKSHFIQNTTQSISIESEENNVGKSIINYNKEQNAVYKQNNLYQSLYNSATNELLSSNSTMKHMKKQDLSTIQRLDLGNQNAVNDKNSCFKVYMPQNNEQLSEHQHLAKYTNEIDTLRKEAKQSEQSELPNLVSKSTDDLINSHYNRYNNITEKIEKVNGDDYTSNSNKVENYIGELEVANDNVVSEKQDWLMQTDKQINAVINNHDNTVRDLKSPSLKVAKLSCVQFKPCSDDLNQSTELQQYSLNESNSLNEMVNVTPPKENHIMSTGSTLHNENSCSTMHSTLSPASYSSTSSSQQLVIDHPIDDTENAKMIPLKLCFKRKSNCIESFEDVHQSNSKQREQLSARSGSNLGMENEVAQPKSILLSHLETPAITIMPTKDSTAVTTATVNLKCSNCADVHFKTFEQYKQHRKLCLNTETKIIEVQQPVDQNNEIKRYFRCIKCKTTHETWSFFQHMRDTHKRFTCFYCLNLFATAEKLSLHLEIKHDLDQNHYNDVVHWRMQELRRKEKLLICCSCQQEFLLNDNFLEHTCPSVAFTTQGKRNKYLNKFTKNNHKHAGLAKHQKFKKKSGIPCLSTTITPSAKEQHNGAQTNRISHTESRNKTITAHEIFDSNELQVRLNDVAQANGLEISVPKLTIPKIKLRVPKEFQKSVDAEMSSSESEEFEDEELDEHNSTTKSVDEKACRTPSPNLDINSTALVAIGHSNSNEINEPNLVVDLIKEEEQQQLSDGDSNDSTSENLTRILYQIERTKLEIQRTKERSALVQKQEKIDNSCRAENETTDEQRWSPTPPASPHLRWCQNEEFLADRNKLKASAMENDQLQMTRCKSVSSDVMDIDHIVCINDEKLTIKENQENQKNGAQIFNENVQATDNECTLHENEQEIDVCSDPSKSDTSLDTLNKIIEESADGIKVANDDMPAIELHLNRPIDKFEVVDFVRLCLQSVYPLCLYCNHARRIAVNAKSLVLHMIAEHRFTATVDSITAEELKVGTIIAKLKSFLPEIENEYLNSLSYCTLGNGIFKQQINERIYECFQCRFTTPTHKELYMHNRRLHMKTAILCFMCRSNFYSFSEILCHICPGEPNNTSIFDIKYRCCLCEVTNIPSPFRLMVHLRKKHFACDVCLEDCREQSKLSAHVWKHKLHHLCYRCGIAYRNKQDITKHLYWKHGTESISCKRCMQKRWRHVYHFCVPPPTFMCEECSLCFSKAVYLRVHKRIHSGDFRYPCTEDQCEEKFVSRRLLLKHIATHQTELPLPKKEGEEKVDIRIKSKDELKHEGNINSQRKEKSVEADEDNELKDELKQIKSEAAAIKEQNDMEQLKNIEVRSHKKRKKNKKSKESLEDLNLIAPNLSESDSSVESGSEYTSKLDDQSTLHLPRVMLSPLSESDNENKFSGEQSTVARDKMPAIWKNLLEAQGNVPVLSVDEPIKMEADYTEDNYPEPKVLHACISDHDYCKIYRERTPTSPPKPKVVKSAKKHNDKSVGHSDFSSDSSSESSSDSGSSSCSCGSNCSCSSSESDSSSSSSSSAASDSTAASNGSPKRVRKKALRKKNDSPVKLVQIKDKSDKSKVTNNNEVVAAERALTPCTAPPFYETDFETAESETDEEFYDEHPQKLANELLAQKRAALMAQTRLSPSHNYDIVENSRPSTPSLPEDMASFGEKRNKPKKKKRDRKSSSKANKQQNNSEQIVLPPPAPAQLQPIPVAILPAQLEPNVYNFNTTNTVPCLTTTESTYLTANTIAQLPQISNYTSVNNGDHVTHLSIKQISEGSSCSDADGILKRSKRTRRPNKFYGYSSDDENMVSIIQPPLMVGMQLMKPLPPPQLTWAKEDLPTPSKSILNSKGKIARAPKTSAAPLSLGGLANNSVNANSRKRVRRNHQSDDKPNRKRSRHITKTAESINNLPPIPTFKIRPAQLLVSANHHSDESSNSGTDEEIEINVTTLPSTSVSAAQQWHNLNVTVATSTMTSTVTTLLPAVNNTISTAAPVSRGALPPVPETTVFNQRIPPALLPNPDFATLQYFKANNIRYPIRPPAGARLARDGEMVYCYCRCPYDEVSEMIACDGDDCIIEWFHFECVGIMVAPQGKWFCAECRPKYSEELYPTSRP